MGQLFENSADKSRIRNHLWDYFELHANQRITLFRFYILFFTLFLTGAIFLHIRFTLPGIQSETAGIVLSILFAITTYVFWKLDDRNKDLIHHAEKAFEIFEKEYLNEAYHIFTQEKKDNTSKPRHTKCFRYVFYLGYSLSICLLSSSIYSLLFHQMPPNA